MLVRSLCLVLIVASACDSPPPAVDAGPPPVDAGPPPPPPRVMTAGGPVDGRRGEGYLEFLGIPFAAPPVGELRWRPPAPAEPWTEARPSRRPARCVQTALGIDLGSEEDCLYVNVHTPDPLPADAPVLVWIHGGAFIFGEGLQTDGGTAGDLLAAAHGVVVVSVNYRLGSFGFLAHPELTVEQEGSSGNYGLMDQRAALEWVRDNAAAFGGDPNNVTVFGESAGGYSVCAHLVSPQSAGLFHRAISQSGLCESDISTLEQAQGLGEQFASDLDCDGTDEIACMRGKTADELLAIEAAAGDIFSQVGAERRWWPSVDGAFLEGDFRTQVEAGAAADVPTIIGWNADEGTLFVLLAEQAGQVADAAAYGEIVDAFAELYAVSGEALRAQYAIEDYADPGAAAGALIGDATLACPSRRAARLLADRGHDVRTYYFAYPDAAFQLPADRDLGAFHSAEIQYVFGHPARLGRPRFSGDDLALHEAMSGYWARFAAGDPNGGGAPEWPAYDSASDSHLRLDATVESGSAASAGDCAIWDAAR